MEPAAVAVAEGAALVRWPTRASRMALAYSSGPRAPRRRVVGVAGLAAPGRRRVLSASLQEAPEPLSPQQQEAALALGPEADEEVHGDAATSNEASPPSGVIGKAVRVRFVLKKQCAFGQRFHLVGDDPALGLWDPSKAIALDWSEGHDWVVEKDLPANSVVEFKFLLQDSSGMLLWQNGPNRSIQTGETTNTLVVYEDWGDVMNQKIEVNEDATVRKEDAIVLDDGQNSESAVSADEIQVADNLFEQKVDDNFFEPKVDDNQEIMQDESSVGDDHDKSTVATNASVQWESVNGHEANQLELTMDELKIQGELHKEVETAVQNGSATVCADNESTNDDSMSSEDGVSVEDGWAGAFEQDKLWGWKALQQLLMSLGFKMDAT